MSARSIDDLVETATFEAERLNRVEALDLRQELRLRVWPFLLDLCELLGQPDEPVGTVPAEPIARALAVIASLVEALGKPLTEADKVALVAQAEIAVGALATLVSPDALATLLAAPPAASADPGAEVRGG